MTTSLSLWQEQLPPPASETGPGAAPDSVGMTSGPSVMGLQGNTHIHTHPHTHTHTHTQRLCVGKLTFLLPRQGAPEGGCQTPDQLHLSVGEGVSRLVVGQLERETGQGMEQSRAFLWLAPRNRGIQLTLKPGVL